MKIEFWPWYSHGIINYYISSPQGWDNVFYVLMAACFLSSVVSWFFLK